MINPEQDGSWGAELGKSGRRLAFVDTEGLRTVDPVAFTDKRVNLLGKLEPLEEGSKDLVIRARLLRPID